MTKRWGRLGGLREGNRPHDKSQEVRRLMAVGNMLCELEGHGDDICFSPTPTLCTGRTGPFTLGRNNVRSIAIIVITASLLGIMPSLAAAHYATLATTDCLLGVAPVPVSRCGARASSVPGQEVDSGFALHNTYRSGSGAFYSAISSTDSAYATARAQYGDLGVSTQSNTIATVENAPNIQTAAYAVARSTSYDTVTVASTRQPAGTLVDITVGSLINRNLTTRSTSWEPTLYLSNSSLFASLMLWLLDDVTDDIRETLLSVRARACSGLCDRPLPGTIEIDDSGIDMYEWTVSVPVGKRLGLYADLRAESTAIFYAPTSGVTGGTSLAKVSSLDSSHTFLRPGDESVTLLSESGASYLLSVPEPSSLSLMLAGLLMLVLKATGCRHLRYGEMGVPDSLLL